MLKPGPHRPTLNLVRDADVDGHSDEHCQSFSVSSSSHSHRLATIRPETWRQNRSGSNHRHS